MSPISGQVPALVGRVRQERLRLGWTQADAADRSGLSRQTYARFERTGQVSFPRLVQIAVALGLEITLSGAAAFSATSALPARQRGRRHPHGPTAAPASGASAQASESAAVPARPRSTPAAGSHVGVAPGPRASASAAAIADVMKRHGDAVRMLANNIVSNRLNNYTSGAVVRAVVGTKRGLDEGGRAAFVAAVEGELQKLTAENCVALGLDVPRFEAWAAEWRDELGIVGALE